MKPFLLLCLAPAVLAAAADPKSVAPPPPPTTGLVLPLTTNAPAPKRRLVYRPPRLGAPKVTIGPGTRSGPDAGVSLVLLAPEHAGLTVSAQPLLLWYQSGAEGLETEVTLVEPGNPDPVLEIRWPREAPPGMQRLDVASHGVQLQRGKEYRWSVALIRDAAHRSQDLVAATIIQRVAASDHLRQRLAGVALGERPFIYAEEGIWYEAAGALAHLMQVDPGNPAWREDAAALASQAGLTEIAAHFKGHHSTLDASR